MEVQQQEAAVATVPEANVPQQAPEAPEPRKRTRNRAKGKANGAAQRSPSQVYQKPTLAQRLRNAAVQGAGAHLTAEELRELIAGPDNAIIRQAQEDDQAAIAARS